MSYIYKYIKYSKHYQSSKYYHHYLTAPTIPLPFIIFKIRAENWHVISLDVNIPIFCITDF